MSEVTIAPRPEFRLDRDVLGKILMLEASAGTGKTFALSSLAARAVIEGTITISQLCMVTFTNAAAAEMRGRVRSRLVEALEVLEGARSVGSDPLLVLVDDAEPAERDERKRRLRAALRDFDLASISTIHGFCTRILSFEHAQEAETPSADDSELVNELVNDVFVSRFSRQDAPCSSKLLAAAVRFRLSQPDSRMFRAPVPIAEDSAPAEKLRRLNELADLVDELVEVAHRRRSERRQRTYDGLITDARDLVVDPDTGVVAALRERFGLVMIDEFQDTDRVQWSLLHAAFLEGEDPIPTVLVGDPKQSIYRFRGAELSAYLEAMAFVERHGEILSLRRNWRSDGPLLTALDVLFTNEGAAPFEFGDPRVRFESVEPADDHLESVLNGVGSAPLQFRPLIDEDSPAAQRQARRDLIAEVVHLLDNGQLPASGKEADASGRRRVRPSDIAVLLGSNDDVVTYTQALNRSGIPASSTSNDSVFDSTAAEHWRRLLLALERPSSPGRVRAVATTWFDKVDMERLGERNEDGFTELLARTQDAAATLSSGGVAALLARLRRGGLASRVLAGPTGDRDLTDLEHIAELLQSATGGRPVSPAALVRIFDELAVPPPSGTEESVEAEAVARRIDRDDDTVSVMTVHKAKGLEFAVVLCPTLWKAAGSNKGPVHAYRPDTEDPHRQIHTGGMLDPKYERGDAGRLKELAKEEAEGESRRLLYVAMTRARHRLVVWWQPKAKTNSRTALRALLDHSSGRQSASVDLPALVDRAAGTIEVCDPGSKGGSDRRWIGPVRDDDEALAVRELGRTLFAPWKAWSYSTIGRALTEFDAQVGAGHRAGAGGDIDPALAAVAEELPIEGGLDEEPEESVTDGVGDDRPTASTPLQSLGGGRAFGTLVHRILEKVDFAGDDLLDRLTAVCTDELKFRSFRGLDASGLAEGLGQALRAPLGGPFGAHRLVDLPTRDRMNELRFDLPLASIDAAEIMSVVARHLDLDDPFRDWFAAVEGARPLAGMLTGSIDLVARIEVDGQPRMVVADYKTTRLAHDDYSASSLRESMCHAAYPLQAVLYLVALHRFLRWRMGDAYDPSEHLAGAGYLYLRGMDPSRSALDARGVLWWRPSDAVIVALDALLARGER